MKITNICPKCSKESPPLEIKGNEEFKFCPYCGAPYREEAKEGHCSSRMRSRIITTPAENIEMLDELAEKLRRGLGK
jgi:NMD protein affecting ribosome stability and mRNA decay